ncbi:MAG: hypothetical protein KAX26_11350 [Anaerolineae bacterium]|nr:hypothetical protein [Anaerolineae bacterium]
MERKRSIAEVASQLTEPFKHIVVGQVDDYCAYLCRFRGVYRFHQHAKDEMYLVLEGEAFVEYQGGPTLPLKLTSCEYP